MSRHCKHGASQCTCSSMSHHCKEALRTQTAPSLVCSSMSHHTWSYITANKPCEHRADCIGRIHPIVHREHILFACVHREHILLIERIHPIDENGFKREYLVRIPCVAQVSRAALYAWHSMRDITYHSQMSPTNRGLIDRENTFYRREQIL